MVQSQDHHAAFFAAAFVAYAAAVAVSIVHVASVVAAADVVVVASVETSWALVAVSSGGFPFEKRDVASASAAAVASVVAVVVVASVAVVVPFAVASVVASSAWVVLAVVASFLAAAAAVVVVAAAASLGCLAGAALVVLVLGTEAGFECHLEVGSLASMLDLAFSASEGSLDSVQLQRNWVGLELPLLKRSQALVVLAAWPQ